MGDERVRHDEQAVDEFGLVAVPESRHVLKLNVLEEEFQQAWSFFRMQKKPNWSPIKFLDWWGAHGSKKYPNIAPFVVFVAAAVPVASANCESMFSYSGATLTKTRNRLSPSNSRSSNTSSMRPASTKRRSWPAQSPSSAVSR